MIELYEGGRAIYMQFSQHNARHTFFGLINITEEKNVRNMQYIFLPFFGLILEKFFLFYVPQKKLISQPAAPTQS